MDPRIDLNNVDIVSTGYKNIPLKSIYNFIFITEDLLQNYSK